MKRYFGNLFRNRHISASALIAFAGDLIQRLTANNPANLLDDRIDVLTNALENLIRCSSDDFAMLGIRKGTKLTKREFRKELPGKMRRIHALVLIQFGDPSREMKRVFPKGRREVLRSRDDVMMKHLDNMVSGVTKYEAALGPDIVTEATKLRDRWLAIHEASKTATGEKTATEAIRRGARHHLEVELHRTVGVLIALFPEDPERYQLYMQESLINRAVSPGDAEDDLEDEDGENMALSGFVSGSAEIDINNGGSFSSPARAGHGAGRESPADSGIIRGSPMAVCRSSV